MRGELVTHLHGYDISEFREGRTFLAKIRDVVVIGVVGIGNTEYGTGNFGNPYKDSHPYIFLLQNKMYGTPAKDLKGFKYSYIVGGVRGFASYDIENIKYFAFIDHIYNL